MVERVVIPVVDQSGLDAQLSEHFGRAPFFAVIEMDDKGTIINHRIIPNTSEHFGGFGHPPDRILQFEPDALITYGMGPRALNIFQSSKVAVLRANANTIKGVISAYIKNELKELTEGCHHAKHP
ncbi:MAG: NifB/NifX family molybdenum-iron cluster-binding protein [Candidatus Hodarchaeota archaeon]